MHMDIPRYELCRYPGGHPTLRNVAKKPYSKHYITLTFANVLAVLLNNEKLNIYIELTESFDSAFPSLR